MTPRHPRRYHAVIGVTALVAVAAALVAAPGVPWRAALLAALAGAAAEGLPARVQDDVSVSLVNVVILTLIVVADPGTAVFAGLGGGVGVAARSDERHLARLVFNSGQLAGSALAAGTVLRLLAGGSPSPASLGVVGALGIAAVVFSLLNFCFVSVVVSAMVGSEVGTNFRSFLTVLPQQLLDAGLAALAALLVTEIGMAALALLAVPTLVARRALLAFAEQEAAYDRLVRALVKAQEVKDGYTRGHAERVAQLAEEVARELGLDYDRRRRIRYGALLHDIGKIGIPVAVLCKGGPLTDGEFALVRTHPRRGTEILSGIEFLEPALAAVQHHHERWDGRGYPAGLAGDDIPLMARIITTVDSFDAMTSTRSYRRAVSVDEALTELERHAGRQFDPGVVAALRRVVRRLDWEITDEPVRTVTGSDATLVQAP